MAEKPPTHQIPLTPESSAALIAQRCAQDPDFRQRLKEDPRACLAEAAGEELPEDLEIVLHQNSGDTWHVPIPDYLGDRELSEKEMGELAGGELVTITTGGLLLAAAATIAAGLIAGGLTTGLTVGLIEHHKKK